MNIIYKTTNIYIYIYIYIHTMYMYIYMYIYAIYNISASASLPFSIYLYIYIYTVVPSNYHFIALHCRIVWISFYFEAWSLTPFLLFNFLTFLASYYTKRKWQDKVICFVLNDIILIKRHFFTSAYFSPFDLKSLLNQKLSSLKAKFCFRDWQINVATFSNIRLHLPRKSKECNKNMK